MTPTQQFWKDHYTKISRGNGGQPAWWLDYSNERVQAQTFALALEAAGHLHGKRCLDVGCGWGGLARCAEVLHGDVVAIDIVDQVIVELDRRYPRIKWIVGSFLDPSLLDSATRFDVVLAVEVLQYVPLEGSLDALWNYCAPGGRLIIVLPNAECPYVQNAMLRFGGHYHAVTQACLTDAVRGLPLKETWSIQGLVFREDQRLLPYEVVSPELIPGSQVPNRWFCVIQREGAAA